MNKLQKFISQLSDPNLLPEQQSFLLSASESDLIAGDNLNGICINQQAGACGKTNDYCTNYVYCVDSTNTKSCTNKDKLPEVIDPVGPGDNSTKDC